ncbi:MAG: hypothetical protein PVH61_27890 [Candidatus Aminicenantes bacterium]|jgi:hypothetical protein
MRARRKPTLIVMIILLVGQLLGNIKITSKLLMPTTGGGEKSFKGVLTITRAKIRIECHKKIFQPFNEFDAPRQSRLNINAADLEKIEIDEDEKKIYLRVKKTFVSRYRNICTLKSEFVTRSLYHPFGLFKEFWAIAFAYEKPLDISFLDKKVLESINGRSYPVFTKYYSYH